MSKRKVADVSKPSILMIACNTADGVCKHKDLCKSVGCCQFDLQPLELPKTNSVAYREDWLHRIANKLKLHLFEPAGFDVPEHIRISCGFPSRNPLTGSKNQAIGQCWGDEKSADGHFEIFVSPVIGDAMVAVEVLAHEMCHAVAGIAAKHGGKFKKVALAIGLEGKMTSTHGGEQFKIVAQDFIDDIGPYPMAALDARKMTNGVKKQTTRLLKCECPMCSYTVRVAKKWLDDVGLPHCPHHGEMELEEK